MMKITRYNARYIVELGDSKLHVLNQRSLMYLLKKDTKFDMAARSSIINIVNNEGKIVIDLATHRQVA